MLLASFFLSFSGYCFIGGIKSGVRARASLITNELTFFFQFIHGLMIRIDQISWSKFGTQIRISKADTEEEESWCSRVAFVRFKSLGVTTAPLLSFCIVSWSSFTRIIVYSFRKRENAYFSSLPSEFHKVRSYLFLFFYPPKE